MNGYQAYGREVRESNLLHVLTCYILDTDLHAFVRGLIASVSHAQRKERLRKALIAKNESASLVMSSGSGAGLGGGFSSSVFPSDVDVMNGFGSGDVAEGDVVSPLRWTPTALRRPRLGLPLPDLPLETVQFGCHFLLDVVLHCRERAGMRAWITVLREAFETFPHTAVWFLQVHPHIHTPTPHTHLNIHTLIHPNTHPNTHTLIHAP